jgi:hypothetical protein
MTHLFRLTKKKSLVVYRYPSGGYVKGEWVRGTPQEVEVFANIQPAKWNEIIQMPESDRSSKWCKLFTKNLMRTKKEGLNGYDADMFYWQGDLYEVRKEKHFDMGILDHFEVMAVRVELTPEVKTL